MTTDSNELTQAAPAPAQSKKKRSSHSRRNGPPEIRRDNQKDSTEQPGSLMKPYYLSHDD